MNTLNLREAAAFLHMHPEEVRTRAKLGLIPGAKIGRRWVFIDMDLAEFIRSQYPPRRQALSTSTMAVGNEGRSGGSTSSLRIIKEYEELLGLKPKQRRKGARRS
jgi:hypothetical protein